MTIELQELMKMQVSSLSKEGRFQKFALDPLKGLRNSSRWAINKLKWGLSIGGAAILAAVGVLTLGNEQQFKITTSPQSQPDITPGLVYNPSTQNEIKSVTEVDPITLKRAQWVGSVMAALDDEKNNGKQEGINILFENKIDPSRLSKVGIDEPARRVIQNYLENQANDLGVENNPNAIEDYKDSNKSRSIIRDLARKSTIETIAYEELTRKIELQAPTEGDALVNLGFSFPWGKDGKISMAMSLGTFRTVTTGEIVKFKSDEDLNQKRALAELVNDKKAVSAIEALAQMRLLSQNEGLNYHGGGEILDEISKAQDGDKLSQETLEEIVSELGLGKNLSKIFIEKITAGNSKLIDLLYDGLKWVPSNSTITLPANPGLVRNYLG